MNEVPLNHKTIFLFDYSAHLMIPCNEPFILDVPAKGKNQSLTGQLPPLNKSMWTCALEAIIEYSRVVYDLFPNDKLISIALSKSDLLAPLNTWREQGYDHLLNVLGQIQPPTARIMNGIDEEMTNLTKSLKYCLKLIEQPSALQTKLSCNSTNSGRIVLLTSGKNRKLDKIQEILRQMIDDYNRDSLKIFQIELCIIDLIPFDQKQMSYSNEMLIQNSSCLITRLLSSQTGSWLSKTIILLAQKFYDLVVTSITHIPMKEESNANSSANYDVEILHEKSVHDKLRACDLLQNCLQVKEGLKTVCLKWSNPKTNITEFNFASHAYRISPLDVNSRPTSCLTTFILSGRCVVLEAGMVPQTRVPSHVLCNYGNEIFIYCLSCFTRVIEDNRPSSMDQFLGKLGDYRLTDFCDFIRQNRFLSLSKNEGLNFPMESEQKVKHFVSNIEVCTRKWPIQTQDSILMNVAQTKMICKHLGDKHLSVAQYNDCIECIQQLQTLENKNEALQFIKMPKVCKNLKKKEQWKHMWCELDVLIGEYQDVSERHKLLFTNISKITQNYAHKESSLISTPQNDVEMSECQAMGYDYDEQKTQKKQKIMLNSLQTGSLFDVWSSRFKQKTIRPQSKDFYGAQMSNPAPLYINLKLDESNVGKKV